MERRPRMWQRQPPTKATLIGVATLVVLLVFIALAGEKLGWLDYRHLVVHLDRIKRLHSPAWLALVFLVTVAVATALGMPGLPFIIASGALFGTMLGSLLSSAATTLGAGIGYWIARTAGHDIVAWWLRRFPKLEAIVADATDFGGVLRLRLLPIVPLAAVTFAAGLARAPFGRYVVASALGSLPSIIIYAYFADSLIEGAASGRGNAFVGAFVASVLLIALSLAPKLIKRAD
jgi:uncharacterized membrane protein YdjX (TVP38/TMEM64 family)